MAEGEPLRRWLAELTLIVISSLFFYSVFLGLRREPDDWPRAYLPPIAHTRFADVGNERVAQLEQQ